MFLLCPFLLPPLFSPLQIDVHNIYWCVVCRVICVRTSMKHCAPSSFANIVPEPRGRVGTHFAALWHITILQKIHWVTERENRVINVAGWYHSTAAWLWRALPYIYFPFSHISFYWPYVYLELKHEERRDLSNSIESIRASNVSFGNRGDQNVTSYIMMARYRF